MNRENLETLATFLEQLPQDKFSMQTYARDEHGEGLDLEVHECMSIGCAVGWGPTAGLPVSTEDLGWASYSQRVFGIEFQSNEWNWCFGWDWHRSDNTPTGAAARIRHLMNHGLPENHRDQSYGRAPRSYA